MKNSIKYYENLKNIDEKEVFVKEIKDNNEK